MYSILEEGKRKKKKGRQGKEKIEKPDKNDFIAFQVRTGDLVRVKHT